MKNIMGRRREDRLFYTEPEDAQPGDYWKFIKEDGSPLLATEWVEQYDGSKDVSGNLTNTVWGYVAPNGLSSYLVLHTVRENKDGTISVKAGDGSSNSIEIWSKPDKSDAWHGYIERGEWRHV